MASTDAVKTVSTVNTKKHDKTAPTAKTPAKVASTAKTPRREIRVTETETQMIGRLLSNRGFSLKDPEIKNKVIYYNRNAKKIGSAEYKGNGLDGDNWVTEDGVKTCVAFNHYEQMKDNIQNGHPIKFSHCYTDPQN